jgi:hypothetical protein
VVASYPCLWKNLGLKYFEGQPFDEAGTKRAEVADPVEENAENSAWYSVGE